MGASVLLRQASIIALAACLAAAGFGTVAAKPRPKAPAAQKTCEKASAIATGFGVKKVTGFANGNLDLAIDKVKDHLAGNGAKGFSIEVRKVSCTDYIDFGGSIGREHKCSATAMVCAKIK
jgi:hypothetical protein